MIKRFLSKATLLGVICTFGLVTLSYGAAPSLDQVKANLQKKLGNRAIVKSVAKTPIEGLYEAHIGADMIYFDASGRYMLQGELVDLQSGENLTEARQADANRIKWSDLPLNQAMKWSKGDGSRKIAVFADPNCGYCKRLEQTLQTMNNITVYTFLIPVLGEDSAAKSKQIWCSKDNAKVWLDWMLRATRPMGAGDCNTSAIDKNLALSKQWGVNGTPAIFFTDGSRIPGAVEASKIEQKLASLKNK